MKRFHMIFAVAKNGALGLKGGLPWHIPADFKFFQDITQNYRTKGQKGTNAVIMGATTWLGMPNIAGNTLKKDALPGRFNIVLDNQNPKKLRKQIKKLGLKNTVVCESLSKALKMKKTTKKKQIGEFFVCGGKMLYEYAIKHPKCASIFQTRIQADVKHDISLDIVHDLDKRFKQVETSITDSYKGTTFDFTRFVNKNAGRRLRKQKVLGTRNEEYQYLELIADVIKNGCNKSDRTGTGTKSLFGKAMRYNLQKSFPLLTTKRTFWRGVAEELLWFLKGSTNANELTKKGVHIWDANGSREFLDNLGFTSRKQGDLGPVYGFQWRHFGAKYTDFTTNYEGKGVDQIQYVIKLLKENPHDRRILLSAWNPSDLGRMALPPCHMLSQFYVDDQKRLSCMLYQRSCDIGLGVPFNIASYALLTCMLAQVCGLKRGEFVHFLGDAHVYNNHIKPLKEQIARHPRPFPLLELNSKVKNIDDFKMSDFTLKGYDPQGPIVMKMAV